MNLEHKMPPNPSRSILCLIGTFILKLVMNITLGIRLLFPLGQYLHLHCLNFKILKRNKHRFNQREPCFYCILGILPNWDSLRAFFDEENYCLDIDTHQLHFDLWRHVSCSDYCGILALYIVLGHL